MKFQTLLEQAYEKIVESDVNDSKKRTQLINFIQELLGAGDPKGILSGLPTEELQRMYNELRRQRREVEAAIADWNSVENQPPS